MAGSPYYKRRRRSLVRNLWVYRRLVVLAIVLGLILWFVMTNNERVNIAFPFGMGKFQSTTGLVILLSVLVGSLATALALTIYWAIRTRVPGDSGDDQTTLEATKGQSRVLADDDLPPPNYAAKTGDGLNRGEPWA